MQSQLLGGKGSNPSIVISLPNNHRLSTFGTRSIASHNPFTRTVRIQSPYTHTLHCFLFQPFHSLLKQENLARNATPHLPPTTPRPAAACVVGPDLQADSDAVGRRAAQGRARRQPDRRQRRAGPGVAVGHEEQGRGQGRLAGHQREGRGWVQQESRGRPPGGAEAGHRHE